jgi:hypothetical protein
LGIAHWSLLYSAIPRKDISRNPEDFQRRGE